MGDLPQAVMGGKYELLERVSTDGVIEVFRARSREARGEVVVKRTLDNSLFSEARRSVSLVHGNVVQVLDAGEEGGRSFLATELIDGLTLAELLSQVDRLEAPVATAIVIEVLRGLHYAHTRQSAVVHGGVSPDNVLLGRAGQVKLTDFGIARGHVYSSPEQLRQEPSSAGGAAGLKPIDARADVYACGMVLWRCLTGTIPRGNAAPSQLLDPELAGLLKRATEADLAQRTPSAQQFQTGLQKWLDRQRAPQVEMAISQVVSFALRRSSSAPPVEPAPAVVPGAAPSPTITPTPTATKPRAPGGLMALSALGLVLIVASVGLVLNARASESKFPDGKLEPMSAVTPKTAPLSAPSPALATPVEVPQPIVPPLPRAASRAPARFKLSSVVHGTDVTQLGVRLDPLGENATARLSSTSKTLMLFLAPVERGPITAFKGTTALTGASRAFLAQPTGWTSFENLDLELHRTEGGVKRTRKIPRALSDSMTFLENAFRLDDLDPYRRYRVEVGAGSLAVLVVADAPSQQRHLRSGEPTFSGSGPPWQRLITGGGWVDVRGVASLRFAVLTWPAQTEEVVEVTVTDSKSTTALGEPLSLPLSSTSKAKDADGVPECLARAQALINAGDGKGAVPYLDKCLALQPTNTTCATLLGRAVSMP